MKFDLAILANEPLPVVVRTAAHAASVTHSSRQTRWVSVIQAVS